MKVSIITATFNNEDTISDTLNSVISQTYKNIEHIIIDGKSSDQTVQIINDHKANITKLISEPDSGIYEALNKGINLATGDIIGFLHADDIFNDPHVIDMIVNTFKSGEVDSVYGDLQYISVKNTNRIIRNWKAGNFNQNKLKTGWMPPHPTFYVKNEIYKKYGQFDTSFKIAADYDIILRFLGVNKITTAYIPKVLIKMRIGGESNKSFKNIIKKMKEDFRALKINKIGGFYSLILKNIIKIPQLFIK